MSTLFIIGKPPVISLFVSCDIHDINPNVVILRFTRVVFGLIPSPFLLNAAIKHHFEKILTFNRI